MKHPVTRRTLIAGTAASAAGLLATAIPSPAQAHPHVMAAVKPGITLKQGATVLLQGDSITDAGRDRGVAEPNNLSALGKGYAHLIAYHLLTQHKDKDLKVYNRGISGNKVPNLDERWDKDCLELKPDVLSIMIGVNDYWHTVAFGKKYQGTVEDYGTGLAALIQRTKESLPDVQLVLCEPFVVRAADGSTRPDWFPEFDQRRAKAKEVAESAGAVFVAFQQMFDDAVAAGTDPKHWSGDNIHVNGNGAALMAMRWLGDTGLA